MKHKYIYLDLLRALSALAVAAQHLKYFLMANINTHSGIFWRIFNIATSQGRNAVMIFFVLSGYLVGGSVYQATISGRWSWREYAIKRLSRLWIVLIPALVLTALLDGIGSHIFHGALYSGSFAGASYGGSLPDREWVKTMHDLYTFLGNVFFLQGIAVQPFGINGPLWSLANEFWYYVIFPSIFFAIKDVTNTPRRIAFAILAIMACLALPRALVLYGVIWLFGFGVAAIEVRGGNAWQMHPGFVAASVVQFLLLLFIVPHIFGIGAAALDFLVGISAAILIYSLTKLYVSAAWLTRTARLFADFSYTLYLVHFPFIALLVTMLFQERKVPLDMAGFLTYTGMLSAAILFAFCVYWLFERNTGRLQSFCFGKL